MVRTHTVVAGETLSALALRFYGDAELARLIATASGLAEPPGGAAAVSDAVEVGQRLVVPDYTRYTASSGDTLPELASRFYGDPALAGLIATASGISGTVVEGQQLVVPELTGYTVLAGDTLPQLANRFYGDAELSALIATVNDVADPDNLQAGDTLVIFLGRTDGFGLTIVDRNEDDPRMWYYRFQTQAIGWNPAVNVLLPDDYQTSGRTYPVLYLLHGGGVGQDFRSFDFMGIRELTAGKPIIVVMPDGGSAGWYSNPVTSFVGPRNWETFHIAQLLPWIDANFRTFAETDGRAVSGFSMGGFGALKYMAKYRDLFASVSSHSGPASLRRDFGLVVHWANLSSAAVELGGGTVYGAPFWNQARVSADNPVERVERYRTKRIFLVAGTSPNPIDWFDSVNETQVLAGQREFRTRLTNAGIPFEAHEEPGGHIFRPAMFTLDLDGIIARLRPAALGLSSSAIPGAA